MDRSRGRQRWSPGVAVLPTRAGVRSRQAAAKTWATVLPRRGTETAAGVMRPRVTATSPGTCQDIDIGESASVASAGIGRPLGEGLGPASSINLAERRLAPTWCNLDLVGHFRNSSPPRGGVP